LVTLDGSLVSWKTKKQVTISYSSIEDKYRSMAATTSKLIWLRALLGSVGVFYVALCAYVVIVKFLFTSPRIQCSLNETKHIEIDCEFVREKLESGALALSYLSSEEQHADILTKALGKKLFISLRGKLGMIDPHSPP